MDNWRTRLRPAYVDADSNLKLISHRFGALNFDQRSVGSAVRQNGISYAVTTCGWRLKVEIELKDGLIVRRLRHLDAHLVPAEFPGCSTSISLARHLVGRVAL